MAFFHHTICFLGGETGRETLSFQEARNHQPSKKRKAQHNTKATNILYLSLLFRLEAIALRLEAIPISNSKEDLFFAIQHDIGVLVGELLDLPSHLGSLRPGDVILNEKSAETKASPSHGSSLDWQLVK